MAFIATLCILFLSIASSHAQVPPGATFKVDASLNGNQITLTTQNPPTNYTGLVITRDGSGFVLTACAGGAAPTIAGGGYNVTAGVQYCDSSLTAGNTYHYTVTATLSNGTTTTAGPIAVPYLVVGNTATTAYKPLFQTQDLSGFITNFVTWATRVGIAIVSIMIMYSGFEYIASRGNETQIKAAKDRIIGSIVGLILLLLVGTIMSAFFL